VLEHVLVDEDQAVLEEHRDVPGQADRSCEQQPTLELELAS